ncbi:VOC family protein [Desulfovibrio ferrophilus]|uniref:27 kDa antigen Cfp30B n=1 Tax=Desulfovibrio ferrophilus TaxID=241368 RepID=A0A2Z6B354_9BACT|nr:VOC family protein [Desulfovibrio ferrophilus]BBD09875.1 27 kDa antigen Cfp30B [Desulfovibrio ferrophilus]
MDDKYKTQGMFSWNELMTTNVEEAKEFYAELFDWQYEEAPMEGGGTYHVAVVDGVQVGGMFERPANIPEGLPAHWRSYVTVDDVDECADMAGAMGGTVLLNPTDLPGVGRFCIIQDPQGAVLNLITYPMDMGE